MVIRYFFQFNINSPLQACTLSQIIIWADSLAILTNLEMTMRACGITSRTAMSNYLSLTYGLTFTDKKLLVMSVQGSNTATMVNDYCIAITAYPAGMNDRS